MQNTKWVLVWAVLVGCATGPDGAEPESRASALRDAAPSRPPQAGEGADAAAPPAPDAACAPGAPTDEAYAPGGRIDDRSAILPGGRRVTPAGALVPIPDAAMGVALSPDGRHAYVTSDATNEALRVVDLETAEVTQTLTGFRAFRGVAVTPDGARVLVAAGREGDLRVFDRAADGQLTPAAVVPLEGYLGAVAADDTTAYVASNTASLVFAVDLATSTVRQTYETGNYPYDLVISGDRLFVSNFAEDTVQVVALADGATLATLETAKGPSGLVADPGGARLYVPCVDEDVVEVVDTGTLEVVGSFDLSHHPEGLLAASPNDVALSPDARTLYVVQADLNQVDLIDADTGAVRGSLPTAWYPVGVQADDDRLVVLSLKGLGATPGRLDPDGMLQVVPLPADVPALTAQVRDNNARPSRFYAHGCARLGAAGPEKIEHVVLIVRENKTYDMVLGDLEGANGDPALTLFGEDVTPNLHALARRYVNFDNFYSNPEESLQGHLWTTQADCGDFVEKLRYSQLPLAGYEHASLAASPNIFQHCLNHGVSFRNYGEVVSFGPELLGRMRDFIDPKYPFFNMDVRDEDKAREVIREWGRGIFPNFIYISLPNDHTYGARPGKPTPESMVADNDRATGMLVDWISRSPYWRRTIVFIIEDDPQSHAGDHVDAHRSIALAISPWVKPGYVSSVHYDIASLYRTIELILGLPPMNKNDANAAPMYDIFREGPPGPDVAQDAALTPFEALPLAVPHAITPADHPMAAESEALPWREDVDGVPGLGRVLWKVRKGDVAPPPYAKGIDE